MPVDITDLGPWDRVAMGEESWPWLNFTPFELRHRADDRVYINKGFLDKLQELRNRCGFGLEISSYYRSPEYNDRISSTGRKGPHTTARAIDILINGAKAHTLLLHACAMGFTGIGVRQNGPWDKRIIHLDDLETAKRPRVWTY